MSDAYGVIERLSDAIVEGRLEVRGETAGLNKKDAEMVALVNRMIEALLAPLLLSAGALEEIAHGRLPPFVIDEYPGAYNGIRLNINTLLAILYGMHAETSHIIDNIHKGKLKTRGNAWDYNGIWKELIAGLNGSLDAVIEPIDEAGEVLERLAGYDLKARMTGRYRGEHAVICKAMNATAQSLHNAISQVSESVTLVTEAGQQINRSGSAVAAGAAEQEEQLSSATVSIEQLSQETARSVDKTMKARDHAKQASDAVLTAKESMERMVASMAEIRQGADGTATIVQEIDSIARENGTLAKSAIEKAANMRTSAGGFGVVAHEIRKISRRCSETAKSMKALEKRIERGSDTDWQEELAPMIADLENIAMISNLLGVNAAIEAAHVEGAGNDFKVMTDEIHDLAKRSADAAKRTDTLTRSSVDLSQKGELLIGEIDRSLEGAVGGANAIRSFADGIAQSFQEQSAGLAAISSMESQICSVTQRNRLSAADSLVAVKGMEQQVEKLTSMVKMFSF